MEFVLEYFRLEEIIILHYTHLYFSCLFYYYLSNLQNLMSFLKKNVKENSFYYYC